MRDRNDGPGVILEKAFQPRDGFGIEMVRRLVEQEQIRRLEQQAAQRDTASLAA